MAKSLGMTQTAISVAELGKRNIRRDFLYQYTNALGISFDEFVSNYCKEQPIHNTPSTLTPKLAQIIGHWLS